MNWKKIIFPLVSVFLAFRTLEMMKTLLSFKPTDLGTAGELIFAILLNLFITGIFAFLGFAWQTSKLLPPIYYHIHRPIILKKSYKSLGVKWFRSFLMKAYWGKGKNRKKYFDGSRNGFENFMYQTKQSEFGHLIPFVLIFIVALMALSKEYYLMGLAMLFINIIGNGYPIILQRYHRERISRLMNKR